MWRVWNISFITQRQFFGLKMARNGGRGRRRTRKFLRLVIPLIVFNSHFPLLEQQMNSNTRRRRCPFIRNRCGTLSPRKHSSAILQDEYSFVLSPEAGLYLLLPCLPMCLESIRMIHDSRAVAPLWIVALAVVGRQPWIINLSSYRHWRAIARKRATLRVLYSDPSSRYLPFLFDKIQI